MTDDVFVPTPEEVIAVHDDLVSGRADSEPGVRVPGAVESAVTAASEGHFGHVPESVHGKAALLCRRLVAEHPFVDGNKRTGLNTAVLLCAGNGVRLDYDDEPVRTLLKRIAVDVTAVDSEEVTAYFESVAVPFEDLSRPAPPDGEDTPAVTPSEWRRLRSTVRSTDDDRRRDAVRDLAALDRRHNAETYDRLARE